MMTGLGMGFGVIGLLLMILFWGALIVGAVWVVRAIFPSGGSESGPRKRDLSAREILDQRYARGELTREEYELTKQDLLS